MKYDELLDRFWETDRNISRNEIALFHYLLYRCNTLGWPDTFSVSNEEIMQTLKLRPDHMRDARRALVESGLLNFQSGIGRGGTSFYSFCEKKGTKREHFLHKKRDQTGTLFSEKRDQMGTPFANISNSNSTTNENEAEKKGTKREHLFDENQEKQQKKKTFPPAPPIKEKKEKKKITQDNILLHHRRARAQAPVRICEDGQVEIFSEDPVNKKRQAIEPNLPKDLDEVIDFFESKAAEKLPDYKAEAEMFYYYFQSIGWRTSSNCKIQDWESRANLWIADKILKNGEKCISKDFPTHGRTAGLFEERQGGRTEPQRRTTLDGVEGGPKKDYTKGF